MIRMILAPFMALFMSAYGLECYYYRIRADDTLTSDNVVNRNCSTLVSSCVKIISRNELPQQEQSETLSTIEGRCAFTPYECAGRERQCLPEPPVTRNFITIHDYKCCSSEDLSNGGPASSLSTILLMCIMLLTKL
ncbi:hypothetical protein COOONC_07550, partial [Cooperia oncophora]